MGYPRHIGHSDDDWTEFLNNIEEILTDYRDQVFSISEVTWQSGFSAARTKISDLAFSVGQKAYMAGYDAGLKEKREQ